MHEINGEPNGGDELESLAEKPGEAIVSPEAESGREGEGAMRQIVESVSGKLQNLKQMFAEKLPGLENVSLPRVFAVGGIIGTLLIAAASGAPSLPDPNQITWEQLLSLSQPLNSSVQQQLESLFARSMDISSPDYYNNLLEFYRGIAEAGGEFSPRSIPGADFIQQSSSSELWREAFGRIQHGEGAMTSEDVAKIIFDSGNPINGMRIDIWG